MGSSPRSPSTSTTLTSPSPSPEPFPVRSSKRSTLPSLMRFPSQELSQFQPHTRVTLSKRLSRPPTSTITQSRPTPPRLSCLPTPPQSTLSARSQSLLLTLPQLLPSLLPQLLLDMLLLPQLLLLLDTDTLLPQLLLLDTLLPQLLPPLLLPKNLLKIKQKNKAVHSKVTTAYLFHVDTVLLFRKGSIIS